MFCLSLCFQTGHKHLLRTSLIAAFQSGHNTFISSTKFCSAFFRSSFMPDVGESLFDSLHCLHRPSASSLNNCVSCQYFPSSQPQQTGRQANLQGATRCRLPPRSAGALSSPWQRQGAQRSPPAAQTICALRSFSATPSLRNLLAAFLTVPHNPTSLSSEHNSHTGPGPCSPEVLPSYVPHVCQNPSHLKPLVAH